MPGPGVELTPARRRSAGANLYLIRSQNPPGPGSPDTRWRPPVMPRRYRKRAARRPPSSWRQQDGISHSAWHFHPPTFHAHSQDIPSFTRETACFIFGTPWRYMASSTFNNLQQLRTACRPNNSNNGSLHAKGDGFLVFFFLNTVFWFGRSDHRPHCNRHSMRSWPGTAGRSAVYEENEAGRDHDGWKQSCHIHHHSSMPRAHDRHNVGIGLSCTYRYRTGEGI